MPAPRGRRSRGRWRGGRPGRRRAPATSAARCVAAPGGAAGRAALAVPRPRTCARRRFYQLALTWIPTVLRYRRYGSTLSRGSSARTHPADLLAAARRVFLAPRLPRRHARRDRRGGGVHEGRRLLELRGQGRSLPRAARRALRAAASPTYASSILDRTRPRGRHTARSRASWLDADERDPDWLAARSPSSRARRAGRVAERAPTARCASGSSTAIADVIDALVRAARDHAPRAAAARPHAASSVLARGFSAERRLDPDAVSSRACSTRSTPAICVDSPFRDEGSTT